MTSTTMIPTKISTYSQIYSDCTNDFYDNIIKYMDLDSSWASLLEAFSSSYPHFNQQLSTLQDKAVL
jgi:hypothetical protein